MENDQRLTPLPLGVNTEIQPANIDFGNTGYSPSSYDAIEGKRSLWQYVNIVYKRLPLILAIAVVVTAAAAIYSYRMESIYQATSQMTIEPRKPAATKKDQAVNIINFGDDRTYYNTQLKLMTNADLMKRVVISLGLHRDPSLVEGSNRGLLGGLRSLWSGTQKSADADNSLPVVADTDAANSKGVQLTPDESRRADILSAQFVAVPEQVPQTNIVNITVQHTNPVL